MNSDAIIQSVRNWVEKLVVGEGLCPFARQPLATGRIRFVVTEAGGEDDLLEVLRCEIERLAGDPDTETTLLIHPNALTDFPIYNQFLDDVDRLISRLNAEGVFQVASFHPDYQFAGTSPGDAENYTNRAPYPLLHLLREESIEAAIETFGNIHEVPERNIRHLRQIGASALAARLDDCFEDSEDPIL